MADRCHGCAADVGDVVVADAHTSGRALLQAADILVCAVRSADLAGPAIAGLLADYPGCAAVAALVPRDDDPLCRRVIDAIVDRVRELTWESR